MRIIKYEYANEKRFAWLAEKDEVKPLTLKTIDEVIACDNLKEALDKSTKDLSLSEITLLAPIEYPKRNIFCIGKNYVAHAKELEGKTTKAIEGIPKHPIYFSKIASPALKPKGIISWDPQVTDHVDYEVELGVIIKKEAKNINPEQVKDYIFGYTIINDITARNLQGKHIQWLRGKSLDTFCPMGPWIVTKDEIANHGDLDIKLSVNDEIRQNSNTGLMIFSIEHIVSELSQGITLKPGDIIATGTPEGVGMGFVPPKYLKPGDEVTCEIEGIGQLTNYVGQN